jgi:lysophospholipase L1-like esterase
MGQAGVARPTAPEFDLDGCSLLPGREAAADAGDGTPRPHATGAGHAVSTHAAGGGPRSPAGTTTRRSRRCREEGSIAVERTHRALNPARSRPGRRTLLGTLVAGAALAGARRASTPAAAGARPATPNSGRGDDDDAMVGTVQFVHPEKVFFYLPGMDEAGVAALHGADVETYLAVRAQFDAAARGAAQNLLADAAFAARVDALPFRPGATLVALGDSFTDDLQFWLEILRHLLERRRPLDGIRIVNLAVSARTTTDVLHYAMPAIGQAPDWVFCLVGGNDAKRIGPEPTKPLVAPAETAANLDALRRLFAAQTDAGWVWLTPATVDPARVAAFPGFQVGQSTWRNDDLRVVAEAIRGRPESVVDLQAVFGDPPLSEYLGPDGLHPSLAGHRAIARAVVERLTT